MSKINNQGITEEQFLKQYNADKYPQPSVTVDLVIFTATSEEKINQRKLPSKELQILLIERGDHPFMGSLALPGGFVNVGENIEAAAYRELKEETNIDNIYMEQLYTWGEVNRDPRTRVISVSYMALVDSSILNIQAGDDAARAALFSVKDTVIKEEKINTEEGHIFSSWVRIDLSNEEEKYSAIVKKTKTVQGRTTRTDYQVEESEGIAFDHAKIILYSLERLRNKAEYTDIAFSLVPELFTLSELQKVYEVVLGKELLAPAFRKKISHMVIETNEKEKDVPRRPSTLYKFNQGWTKNGF